MKKYLLSLCLVLSLPAWANALTIDEMRSSTAEAGELTEILYGADNIIAFQATKSGSEVEVELLVNQNDAQLKVSFGCHRHGNHIDCHEEGEADVTGVNEDQETVSFALLKQGEREGLKLLTARLRDSLVSYKVWAVVEDHDHKSADDVTVWVRFNLNVQGTAQTFFAACHDVAHGDHSHFHCHISRNAPVEPTL